MSTKNAHKRKPDSVSVVDANAALGLATNQTYKENVFLFAPNIIGVWYPLDICLRV